MQSKANMLLQQDVPQKNRDKKKAKNKTTQGYFCHPENIPLKVLEHTFLDLDQSTDMCYMFELLHDVLTVVGNNVAAVAELLEMPVLRMYLLGKAVGIWPFCALSARQGTCVAVCSWAGVERMKPF